MEFPSKEILIFKENILNFYKSLKISYLNNEHNLFSHVEDVISSLEDDLDFNTKHKPNIQPVCRFLDVCISETKNNDLKQISETINSLKHFLNWRLNDNYKNIFEDNFFKNESFVEIIGPSGLLICDKIRVGLLLLGDHVLYPSHNHQALEFYTILSGSSVWQINDENFILKKPGDKIFHDEWVTHAMKTNGEPILALFSWSGMIEKEAIPLSLN